MVIVGLSAPAPPLQLPIFDVLVPVLPFPSPYIEQGIYFDKFAPSLFVHGRCGVQYDCKYLMTEQFLMCLIGSVRFWCPRRSFFSSRLSNDATTLSTPPLGTSPPPQK